MCRGNLMPPIAVSPLNTDISAKYQPSIKRLMNQASLWCGQVRYICLGSSYAGYCCLAQQSECKTRSPMLQLCFWTFFALLFGGVDWKKPHSWVQALEHSRASVVFFLCWLSRCQAMETFCSRSGCCDVILIPLQCGCESATPRGSKCQAPHQSVKTTADVGVRQHGI